jgi:hypothetical protein
MSSVEWVGVSMRRVIIACVVGTFLLGALFVVASATGWRSGAEGVEVWWHEGNGPLIKAVFRTTAEGIVHQRRYEPEALKLIFKPVDGFPKPVEGGYSLWTFSPSHYTIDEDSPAVLSDFFTEGAQYWLQITVQD